jgi:acylphosphatase
MPITEQSLRDYFSHLAAAMKAVTAITQVGESVNHNERKELHAAIAAIKGDVENHADRIEVLVAGQLSEMVFEEVRIYACSPIESITRRSDGTLNIKQRSPMREVKEAEHHFATGVTAAIWAANFIDTSVQKWADGNDSELRFLSRWFKKAIISPVNARLATERAMAISSTSSSDSGTAWPTKTQAAKILGIDKSNIDRTAGLRFSGTRVDPASIVEVQLMKLSQGKGAGGDYDHSEHAKIRQQKDRNVDRR